jgi:uncharacterized membrane protein YgcG
MSPPIATPPRKALWLRLRAYQFDHLVDAALADRIASAFGPHHASTRAFASKLRRKLGWETRFALRALDEYKKFLFLGVTGSTPVTPSKVIDQVWHEHLLFTRAYRQFCKEVLHHDFDHHPELVPEDSQTALFSEQYEETLRRYVAEFNVLPPPDIWGTPKFTLEVKPRSRRPRGRNGSGSPDGDALYLSFDGVDGGPSTFDLSEFGGGGGFAGGGGSDSWGAGDSGGDAGSGSGCSSSCGGGCGGE